MALTEKLQILITADSRGAQQEFNKLGASAEKAIGKTDDRLAKMSGQMVSFGATTLVAGGVAAAGLYKLASAAGDLEESQNKANVVLGTEGARALEEFANGAASAAGISKRAAIDAGSSFAIFGKSAGLSGQGLADFSVELTQLAGDLASFNNTTTDEAVIAIGAALRGESEPIRKYGVLLDDATLKAQAMEMGIYSGSGALSQQQRVLAAQAQILKQTTDAQGDFGRTSDSLANQQRQLAAEFENTKASIGEALLPAFQSVVGGLSDVTGAFNSLPEGTKQVAGGIAGIATAAAVGVGGLSLLIGTGMKVVDTFAQFRQRIGESEGPLGKLSRNARDAEGNLTALGKAGKGLQFAAGAAGALLLADALYSLTFDAAAAEDKLNTLKLLPEGVSTGESLSRLAAYGEEYKSLNDVIAGAFTDKIVLDADGFGVGLNAIETALENLNKSGNIPELEAGLQSIREAAALPVNDAISAELISLADRYEGVISRQKAAAGEATDANGEQAGSLDGLADSTDGAKEASDALKATLSKLSAVQKLANLQFEVGAKRAEAFGDSIERSTNADDLLGSAIGAGKALRGLREQLGLVPAEADKAEDSTNAASETLERLADAASMADPAVSELGISMDAAAAGADAFNRSLAQSSGLGSQLDAAVDLGEAFREVDRSARRLPKTLDLTAISLGELRPRQLDAIRDLRSLGAATNEYLTALLKSGASADEVRKQAAGFRAELEAQLRQAGLSEEAIRQYTEAATLAPAQIETAIKLSGVEQARFKLNAYLGLLEGKIPPEIATSVITAIEAGDLDGAAAQLKRFADTNPVAIDLTPKGVDKLEEAVGKVSDLPRVYDPLIAATGGYSEATLDALDSVLGLGDAYKDTLSQLASDDPSKAVDWATEMREQFARTVDGLNLTSDELEAYYQLLGIAEPQVETAVKISIDDGELFALTTTIDLLNSMDGLSPEVQLQLSSALLAGDYDKVRALLETAVRVPLTLDTTNALLNEFPLFQQYLGETETDTPLGIDAAPALLRDFPAFQGFITGTKTDTPVGINDDEARGDAWKLAQDIQSLNPKLSVDIVANFAEFATAFPLFGNGYIPTGGPQGAPLPGLGYGAGDIDNNPATPFATGGYVQGKGTGMSDDIPAKLSNGEYVIRAAAVDKVGVPALNAINAGMAPTAPAGPTAALMQPTTPLSDDKGQAALLDALRQLAANMPEAGDQITVNGAVDALATAEQIVRLKRANKYLAGRA